MRQACAQDPKNFENAFAVGEQLRTLAFTGEDGSDKNAQEAAMWFRRVIALNPRHVNGHMHLGMCLDWVGNHEEAAVHFTRALELDPNHWYPRGMMGWHLIQIEKYEEAREWLLKSSYVNWTAYPIATPYLGMIDRIIARQNAETPRH